MSAEDEKTTESIPATENEKDSSTNKEEIVKEVESTATFEPVVSLRFIVEREM